MDIYSLTFTIVVGVLACFTCCLECIHLCIQRS